VADATTSAAAIAIGNKVQGARNKAVRVVNRRAAMIHNHADHRNAALINAVKKMYAPIVAVKATKPAAKMHEAGASSGTHSVLEQDRRAKAKKGGRVMNNATKESRLPRKRLRPVSNLKRHARVASVAGDVAVKAALAIPMATSGHAQKMN
jgi:hypothetical protein